MTVVAIQHPDDLVPHLGAWEDLAAAATKPNVFYESWMLLPAARAYAGTAALRILLVFAEARATANNPRILVGLFPFEVSDPGKWLHRPTARMWRYPHCYLTAPLVRRGYEATCLEALLGWLAAQSPAIRLVEFPMVAPDDAFGALLMSELTRRSSPMLVEHFRSRAQFRPAATAELFLQSGLAGKHRKDLRRRRARLEETGRVRVVHLEGPAELDRWIDDFLELERRGWKGQEGTALQLDEADRRFFRAAVQGAAERQRLSMMALLLDDRPIAMKCSFLAGDGGFAFKIAYDETYAYYSPGLLLEIEHVAWLHAERPVAWMDSCAVPDHFMINRLWPDRHTTHAVLLANGGAWPALLVALIPVARLLRREMQRLRARGLDNTGDSTHAAANRWSLAGLRRRAAPLGGRLARIRSWPVRVGLQPLGLPHPPPPGGSPVVPAAAAGRAGAHPAAGVDRVQPGRHPG